MRERDLLPIFALHYRVIIVQRIEWESVEIAVMVLSLRADPFNFKIIIKFDIISVISLKRPFENRFHFVARLCVHPGKTLEMPTFSDRKYQNNILTAGESFP